MEYRQLFVGGDLSGIQRFLYTISSKKAAVSLKGRSYYLRQYMDNACTAIAHAATAAGAVTAEAIYCSGGKFYLLTDSGAAITSAIDATTRQLQQSLWQEHQGQLGLCVSYVPFTENSDGTVDCGGRQRQQPGCLWQAVNAQFHRQKSQRFKDLLIADYDQLFTPLPVGGQHVCAVTGIESPDCVKVPLDDGEEMYVLPSVKQQIQIGEELRRQQHFRTFEEYADGTKLGILRMDADGLGKHFIQGFSSIRAYKVFSARLVAFFEKRTEAIQQEAAFRDHLNIIYAGGDDLFAVGRWDKVIDFAARLNREVMETFAADAITLSGGVAITGPKFPIAKGALMAGEAEEAAKRFRDGEKNAFHFLGQTVSWGGEFDYVDSYRRQFVSLIEGYGLSKGILHKLMLYAAMARQNEVSRSEGKAEDFSYVWHISYYLTRYIARYKANTAVCDFCRHLRDKELDYRDQRRLTLIALAARWAELTLRDKNKNT